MASVVKCTLTVHRLSGRAALGADGLVRALHAATPDCPLTLDEARVWSGVAFRAYQLTPDDNWAYRDAVSKQEWAWSTLAMDSYGVKESLSTHLQRDLREWPIDKPATLVALVRVELGEGRGALVNLDALRAHPALAAALDEASEVADKRKLGCGEWGFVSAITTPKDSAQVDVPAAFGAGVTLTFDALAKDNADLPPVVLTLRPPYEEPPASRLHALKRDVLTFAGAHANSKRELNYQDEFYYASGHRAWAAAAELLGTRWADSAGDAGDEGAATTADYLPVWLADIHAARHSAARAVPNAAVAARFAQVATALDKARAAAKTVATADERAAIAAAIERAAALDAEAISALGAWLRSGGLDGGGLDSGDES